VFAFPADGLFGAGQSNDSIVSAAIVHVDECLCHGWMHQEDNDNVGSNELHFHCFLDHFVSLSWVSLASNCKVPGAVRNYSYYQRQAGHHKHFLIDDWHEVWVSGEVIRIDAFRVAVVHPAVEGSYRSRQLLNGQSHLKQVSHQFRPPHVKTSSDDQHLEMVHQNFS
jgi:hypothetical protein